jgi:hypothetical protein
LHSQADAGSFILDGARQRWIIDLGADDYDLPGYFDHGADNRSGPRWRYYRTQTAGHNTLVVDGSNQIPDARTPIIGNCVDGDCKWAVFDLSAAYGKPAGSIRRGAALIGRQVVIQDDVRLEFSGTIPAQSQFLLAALSRASARATTDLSCASLSRRLRASSWASRQRRKAFRLSIFDNCTVGRRSMAMAPKWRSCLAVSMTKAGAPQAP